MTKTATTANVAPITMANSGEREKGFWASEDCVGCGKTEGDGLGGGDVIIVLGISNGATSGYRSTTLGLMLITYWTLPIPEPSISVALGYLLA